MIKKLAFMLGLSTAVSTSAQLDVDVNKNYMNIHSVNTAEVSDRMSEQQIGMDVMSNGDIVMGCMIKYEGAYYPYMARYSHSDGYGEIEKWSRYKGFSSQNLPNEVKVLSNDWVVFSGKGFVIITDDYLKRKYTLDSRISESFRDADFMEIDQTPDGKVVVLYSYNYENARDELGMLVVDLNEQDFYYAKIGYTGDWDYSKRKGGTAKSFEMAAISDDYCVVGLNPQRNDADEYENAYIVVDINKVINAGDAAKVDAVTKYGHFGGEYDAFRDMAWDKENKKLYVCLGDRDNIVISKMKVSASSSGVSMTKEDSEKFNGKKLKSPTDYYYGDVLSHFSKNGYNSKLVLGGKSEMGYSDVEYGQTPNINVFSGNSLSQNSGAGRSVTNKINDKDGNPISDWETKEVVYIGKSLADQMNGNYKDAFAVLVYEREKERAKLILVDVSYMGL